MEEQDDIKVLESKDYLLEPYYSWTHVCSMVNLFYFGSIKDKHIEVNVMKYFGLICIGANSY